VGAHAGLLFALGILASGILSIPVMAACSAYGLAELFGWVGGLDKKVWQARGFYLLLTGALVVGAGIALLHISPIDLLYWSQVINGFLLPPLFVVLLLLCNDRRILRGHTNGLASNLVGWGTVLVTGALAILTLKELIGGH
jgi:Mn2+/Fe2+ NRAMP family transporter